MNQIARIGDNNPPDAIEEIQSSYDDTFSEVENWLDGEPVENEEQMKAIDALLKSVKAAEKDANDAKELEFRPHKTAADAVVERWKPFLDDLTHMKKGLTAAVGEFKKKLAAEKEAARRAAFEEAERKRREAEEAARAASAADIQAQREAAQAQQAAEEAQRKASAASKDTVKGLRLTKRAEIIDGRACINWIAINDRDAMQEFMQAYVNKALHAGSQMPAGVEVVSEKRAF